MLQQLTTRGVGPAVELKLDLAPRLNLLTGDNGLGKTFVLEALWFLLTDTWAGPKGYPRSDSPEAVIGVTYAGPGPSHSTRAFQFPNQNWSIADRQSPDAVVVYARADGGVSVHDPRRNTFQFDSRTVFDGFETDKTWGGEKRRMSNGLIVDWVNWQFQHAERFQALTRALSRLSPPHVDEKLVPGIPVRVSIYDPRDIPTIHAGGVDAPVTHASAAVKRIIALAYVLVWAWYEHVEAAHLTRTKPANQVLLLVDEVEAHLHPQWQRSILPAVLDVMKELSADVAVQTVVATHSPLVLASVESMVDSAEDALFHFGVTGVDGRILVEKMDWRPRGDASAWLTSDVFGLRQARSIEAEKAIEHAKAALLDPSLPPDDVRRIHHELLTVLKDTDPFWARWLYRAEQAGLAP